MQRVGTEHFMWSKSTKTFIAEISELPKEFTNYFDDTITLISEKTGEEVTFEYTGQDRMNDEICGWRFRAVANTMGIENLNAQVLIIND